MPDLPIRPTRKISPRAARVERPRLPADVDIKVPADLRHDIRGATADQDVADDVLRAVVVATQYIEDEAYDEAMPYVLWAKQAAGRSAFIRELLGILHYHRGEWREAMTELRTYQRLLARADQAHLIADCLRALGRSPAEVGREVETMLADPKAHGERRVEAIIVWASALTDAGEYSAARAALRRVDRELLSRVGEDARMRFTYVVGDVAEKSGQLQDALKAFRRVASMEEDPYEAGERVVAIRERLREPSSSETTPND